MPVIKEFKEFFLRSTQVNSGAKPDQEVNFPISYLVSGISRLNRFLAGHFPSESVIKKLFESIPFKLNQEDTASSTVQGLVRKSTDAIAFNRTINLDSDFSLSVAPHQLSDIVTAIDGSDTSTSSSEVNNLRLTILNRNIGSGRTRKNFLLENTSLSQAKYLKDTFTSNNTTLAIVLGVSANALTVALKTGKIYKFKVYLFINPNITGGLKVGFITTATASVVNYRIEYDQDNSNAIELKAFVTSLASASQITAVTRGVCKIEGTLECSAGGNLSVAFAQQVASGTSSVLNGSSFTIQELVL